MKIFSLLVYILFFSPLASAHGQAYVPEPLDKDRLIEFPDTTKYQTLVLDPHTHSVFSDGHVWPRIRVEEALRDGLDAMAVTEHLEWQPHLMDLQHKDRNRSYDIAQDAAKNSSLLVIPGSEITRNPQGHMNALFVNNSNALFKAPEVVMPYDAMAYREEAGLWPAKQALLAAKEQDAFVILNHPGMEMANQISVLNDFHREVIAQGLVQGVEVANQHYDEDAFQIALEHDLTIIGSSDIHELIDWQYEPHNGGHRPVTLVFANERSLAGIKEAMLAKRTVAWIDNLLIGRDEQMAPLLSASLTFELGAYFNDMVLLPLTITNHSDADFRLQNNSAFSFYNGGDVVVSAHSTKEIIIKTVERLSEVSLTFTVLNALVAPKTPATIHFTAAIPPEMSAE